MARIESNKGFQLSLPEGSTVIVVQGSGTPDSAKYQRQPFETFTVPPELVRGLVQDYLDRGVEDIDVNNRLTKYRRALQELGPQNVNMLKLRSDLETVMAECDLEGRKMGSTASILTDARDYLVSQAEDALTTPRKP